MSARGAPPYRIVCARCGRRVRWRRVRDERYDPPENWAFPKRCGCGARPDPGAVSITVREEERTR